jgi:hypothetical protein
MMSIVASHDNSNPRQSRRDDESGHRRSRHNRFARMVLQLHNQTARPQCVTSRREEITKEVDKL